MDANLIYEKTASGEEAVRQRTRVVQRNTRMVLILVDGKSSVGELCEKTGNAQLVESALQDLERDGLIAPKLEHDSVWEQSKKLAEEIKAAAVQRLARETPETAQPEPLPEISPVSVAPPPEPFSIAPLSMSPQSTFSAHTTGAAPFSTFDPAPSITPPPAAAKPVEQARSDRPGMLASLLSRSRKDDDSAIGPIRRGARGPFVSMPLAISLGIAGLLLLAALVFALYPYDSHRPQIEAALTRLAGQPVHVGEVRASFSPRPAISLDGVRTAEGGGLQAARIRLVPEVFSLLGSRPVFSSVEIESARMQAKALVVLPKAIGDAMASGAPAQVRAISFSQLEVDVLGLSLKELNAEIKASDTGKVDPVTFQSNDRSLKIILKSQAGGFVAEFEGYGWRTDAESRFRFDSLQGQAVWDGRSLAIRSLDARIFDGAVQGVLLLDQGAQPTLAGDITVKHMNLQRLGGAFGFGTQFEGELAGALRFSGQAPTWDGVLKAASGEGDFTAQRGVLGNVDLVEGVRRGKVAVRGGATRYEQLSGRLKITPEAIRFSDLALASGLLRSGGYLEVARDGKLVGRLDVEMRGTASAIRMPLAASGTLKDPVLQGTK